ncbi:MAG TPA: cytochrome c biogenesis protein CcdA [Chloroflexota bacterium]|nr:cytochrome c biogenesis protein CcdA [Chloroflexota bacterium]
MTADAQLLTHSRTRASVAFGLLGILLGLGLVAVRDRLYQVQGSASLLATALPFGYAYAAGVVAAFNPCGILLVPSLVAYVVGSGDGHEKRWEARAGGALVFGVMASLGFAVVFAAVGLLFAITGSAIGRLFPIGGLLVGFALGALGAWLLVSDRPLGIVGATRVMERVRLDAQPRSLFVFGVAYGVASLACTLPVFLVVVGSALTSAGLAQAAAQFVSYATGMGTALTAVILGAALFQGLVARSLRLAAPHVHRLAAAMLLGAGIFVVHYWLGPSRLLLIR